MNPVLWLGVPWTVLLLLALPTALLFRTRFDYAARAARATEERPWATRLLGAANLLLVVLVAGAAKSRPALGVAALVLLLLLALLLLAGLSGAAITLGRRLRPDAPADSAASFALGWLLLAGVPLLPLFGPLCFLWLAAAAAGAPLLGVRGRRT